MKKSRLHLLFLCVLMTVLAGCYDLPEESVSPTFSSGTEETAPAPTDSLTAGFTEYADYEPYPADILPLMPGTASDVLIAYFSRSANTYIPQDMDVDAVTSASLMVSPSGGITGNAQKIAEWIADTTGGDLYAIQTEFTYPADYEQTVSVGEGQDTDGYLPELVGALEDPGQYRYIYLVYPIWHYTLPAPVCSFLTDYDFSGSTIYAFTTNAGSRFGDTIERIQALQPHAEVVEGISVSQQAVPEAKAEVIAKAEEFMQQTGQADETQTPSTEEQVMQIQIGEYIFDVLPAQTQAAKELTELLAQGPVTIAMSDYGGFEKVGPLRTELSASNEQITTEAGDIMLYNGDNIVLFYGSNTWAYTPLGKVMDLSGWEQALGAGSIIAVFSLPG